ERAFQFVPVEGFATVRFFYHHKFAQLYPLERREAAAASRAMPPAPDRGIVLARTAVFDLLIVVSAKRAAHGLVLLIDREAFAKFGDARGDRGFNGGIAVFSLGGDRFDDFYDKLA